MPNEYSNFSAPDTGSASQGYQKPGDVNAQGYVWDPVARQYVKPGGAQVGGNASPNGIGPSGVNGLLPVRTYDPEAEKDRYRGMAAPIYGSGPMIDRAVTNQSRGFALDSLDMLRKRAEGGQTPAQLLARQQTQGAVAGIQSGAASIKGGASARAAAARGAIATGARVGAQGAQDEQALRAREMADASNQYFGASSAQRDRDLGLATDQAKLNAGQRVANEQRSENYEGLGFGTQKENVDHLLGRSAEEASAADASRRAGLSEREAARGLVKDVGGTVVSGGAGALNAYNQTKQPEKSDNPWDPSNYSGSDPRMKRDIHKVSDKEAARLSKHADAMLAGHRASLGAGPAVGRTAPEPVAYDGKYLGSPFPSAPDMISGAAPVHKPKTQSLHEAMAQATEGADPYATPAPEAPRGESLFGGRMGETAPKGYAAMRAGHEGSMFGASPEAKYGDRLWGEGYSAPTPQWAPGTGDFYAGKEGRAARDRDIAMSDPAAKREAYLLGRAHQNEQSVTGKSVEFAYGGKPRPDEDIIDKDPSKATKPREMQTFHREAPPKAPPGWLEQQARAVMQPQGAPLPMFGVGPMTGLQTAQGIGAATTAAAQAPTPAAETVRAQTTSDPKSKTGVRSPDAMAEANRSMEPSSYEYKPEFTPPEQEQGEVNVGPMANKMEANPVAKTAIVKDPNTGLLAIDKTKGLKLVMGGLADLQRQVDRMKGARQ